MYVAFAVILIALFMYQLQLRISLIKILTYKINPQQFLSAYQELDSNKYTNDRYIYESLAYILIGDFVRAEHLLNHIKNKKDDILKADVLLILCYYFSENYVALANAVSLLEMHFNEHDNKKYAYYIDFARMIDVLAFNKTFDSQLAERYFNSLPKKDIIEVYIASYILGEAKLKLGDLKNALLLFENIIEADCDNTILHSKAKLKIETIEILTKKTQSYNISDD